MNDPEQGSAGYEVERKWKLHRLPDRLVDPESEGGAELEVECLWMRQGYLTPARESDFKIFATASIDDVPSIGRIRSIEPRIGQGEKRFVHTIKTGSGLVRRERERDISQAAFEAAWRMPTVANWLRRTSGKGTPREHASLHRPR